MRGIACSVLVCACAAATAHAQSFGTAFTYQGELTSAGAPASGPHDMQFRLFDSLGGSNQIGQTLCANDVTPDASGRFTVSLDFGSEYDGQPVFLEIAVKPDAGLPCADPAGYLTLGPRKVLTPVVYALHANVARNADQLNGQSSSFYQNAANLTTGTIPSGRIGGSYTGFVSFSNGTNSFAGSFSGIGTGLVSLNASALLSGTVPDARLAANIVRSDAATAFTGIPAFNGGTSGSSQPFTVDSNTRIVNLNSDLLDGFDSSSFGKLSISNLWTGTNIFNGLVSLPADTVTPPRLRRLVLSKYSFQAGPTPASSTTDPVIISDNIEATYAAAVNLPDGAVVTALRLVVEDPNNSTDTEGFLLRRPLDGSAGGTMAQISSNGSVEDLFRTFSDVTISAPTIDNATNTYVARVDVGGSGVGLAHRFKAIIIEYEVTALN